MVFWVFQIIFDMAFVGFAVLWLNSRRRIQDLESEVEFLKARPTSALLVSEAPTLESAIETPLGAPISTLSEKSLSIADKAGMDAYEKADNLLSKGVEIKEVARQTGLSISELRLLGKMTHRNQ